MNNERIIVGADNMKHIQAYIDYRNIVGDDDGGKMMTEKEFEAYKKKVAEARRNHLYVYWTNLKNYDCKAIGPESMCFCGHRFKSHNFDNVKTKKVNCKTTKCKCPLFDYIPVYGSNDVKCLCKHSFRDHDVVSELALNANVLGSVASSLVTAPSLMMTIEQQSSPGRKEWHRARVLTQVGWRGHWQPGWVD